MIEKYTKSNRLMSLDALRGFDMFWIMGGNTLIIGLAALTGWPFFDWASGQMDHVEWNGFAFYDMIFPLFLFIAGVSMPYSLEKRKSRGDSNVSVYRHMVKRMVILILLGMLYNGVQWLDPENMRFLSVLGRIGTAWFFAALIVFHAGKSWQWVWFIVILLGYWAIMALVPVPGYGAGDYSWEGNLVGYIDRLLVPGTLYEKKYFDPECLLSLVPAVGTALMGALTGEFLKSGWFKSKPVYKGLTLLLAGMLALIIGHFWGYAFPVNKKLWTSSYVLVAGGWSLILLGVFYLVIDVWGFRKWAFFFTVIGLNSIVSYLMQPAMCMNCIKDFFFHGIIEIMPDNLQLLVDGIAYVSVCWVFLYILYRKKIFLKV